ncbi:MAG: ATP-binding cassette domain-containing protein [Verrucomicrobiaceae bacterium]|nr:ATP-binding cassette domain-containing protein [Verrucomicrobiaceae bacterium]
MSLISFSQVSLRYDTHVLLHNADLAISEGDRLAIVGRNGCGKTSLLKLMAGIIKQDSGLIETVNGIKTAYLQQEVPTHLNGKVFDIIAEGMSDEGRKISKYRKLMSEIDTLSPNEHNELDKLLHFANDEGGFAIEAKINEIADRLELNPEALAQDLSAGLKRRVLLGRELAGDPDILLLDEPTNHLDIDSVLWLEKFLKTCGKTLAFVSHDRTFLENLANRVVGVDRGELIAFDCGFKDFLRKRDELLEAWDKRDIAFDKKLAKEEAWLRQGIKARRTRNEGRVKELMRLRQIRAARRDKAGSVGINLQEAERTGQKVMTAQNISVSYGAKNIIKDFSTVIYSGDKIGVIGKNGAGKTTLLNALLGKLKLTSGEIKYGTNLQIAYFDQLRGELNPKQTPFDFIGGGGDFVFTNGQKLNVQGYLQNFLFTPEQIRGEIALLSGGERNRLMLAKLFSSPANVIVLDEPTNDLDMETIEVLEATLVSFKGTILLVSHDRAFLNNIVTAVFGFEENGEISEIVGGYDEWNTHCKRNQQQAKTTTVIQQKQKTQRQKLSNKERQELEDIPKIIAQHEAEQKDISEKLQSSEFIINNASLIPELEARLAEIEAEDERLFERWTELDARN